MMPRQRPDGEHVRDRNGERLEREPLHFTRYANLRRLLDGQTADDHLDHDLPCSDGADPHGRGRVRDRAVGGTTRLRIVVEPPKERLSIEQQPHYLIPNACAKSSGRGASKFSPMRILPFIVPDRRRFWRTDTGTSLTMGRPAFAMTMSPPLAASSTRREIAAKSATAIHAIQSPARPLASGICAYE